MIYIAANGDTWDGISFKAFGDEFSMYQIMEYNREFSDIVVFDGGERVFIPDKIVIEDTMIATPWQTGSKIAIITPPWS